MTERTASDHPAERARSLGIALEGEPGPWNAITDVEGVTVGYSTLVRGDGRLVVGEGPVRTGVTALFPRGAENHDAVFAAWHSLNGNGEMTGTTWIEESGFLETPVLITNTFSVGTARDAAVEWISRRNFFDAITPGLWYTYPLVAETYDGVLNDIVGQHVTGEAVLDAMDAAASGPLAEGNVGGGTGMICHDFKGGTGTSSRIVSAGPWTVGVLVQANYGTREQFMVTGVPVGREISDLPSDIRYGPAALANSIANRGANNDSGSISDRGSVIAILATDAPLLPHQLKRLARRIPLGIGRTGGLGANGSGDIFLAFSTANEEAHRRSGTRSIEMVPNDEMDPLFEAAVQATEEAVLNALVTANTMTGINGNTVHALPHDRLRDVLRAYNRLVED